MNPKAVIATDIDGTLLPYGAYADYSRAGRLVEKVEGLGYLVVPVTTKSIWEIISLWEEMGLGLPRAAIAESGGAIYMEPGLLSGVDGSVDGLEYRELAPRLDEFILDVRGLVEEACGEALFLAGSDPETSARITLLPPKMARAASRRLYLEVVYHDDRECLARASRRLEARGYYVFLGRRLLHVGKVAGKRGALEHLMREPLLRGLKLAAIGDTRADAGILEMADEAGVVGSSGRDLGIMLAHYHTTPYPPPEGWIDVVSRIISSL